MITKEQILHAIDSSLLEKSADLRSDAKRGYWRGVSSMEKNIAESHGKKSPNRGLLGTIGNNQSHGLEINKGTYLSSVLGYAGGSAAGIGALNGLTNLVNKHPAVKRKVSATRYFLPAAIIGGTLGSVGASYGRHIENLEGIAKKYHKKYSKGNS